MMRVLERGGAPTSILGDLYPNPRHAVLAPHIHRYGDIASPDEATIGADAVN